MILLTEGFEPHETLTDFSCDMNKYHTSQRNLREAHGSGGGSISPMVSTASLTLLLIQL